MQTGKRDERIGRADASDSEARDAHSAPFAHIFPATPVRPACTCLAVRHGMNVYPVVSYLGRDCYVTGSQRIRRKKGWGYFNSLSVNFLDGTVEQIPAAKFNKDARAAIAKATQPSASRGVSESNPSRRQT